MAIPGLVLYCACGCTSHEGVERAAVSGRVTLDGVVLGTRGTVATISFFAVGATKGPAAGGRIENGQYAVAAASGPVVGRNRVEIRCAKRTGRKVADVREPRLMIDETVESVPDRYNAKSTLDCEIKPGDNRLDFDLTAQGLPPK